MKDFLDNVSRFPKFLAIISLGILSAFIAPLLPLLKRPSTAIASIVLLVGSLCTVAFILRAMLGIDPI
jgi:Protein of unknown function (DUF751)